MTAGRTSRRTGRNVQARAFGWGLAALVAAGALGGPGCIPAESQAGAKQPKAAPTAKPASTGAFPVAVQPSPPPAAPTPPSMKTGNIYTDRFLELWVELHDMKNGYFSEEGVPYHSVETLLVEAPDHGHETTSEAYSYWVWLEAMYGKTTGDWSWLERSWQSLEYYIIPLPEDQPSNQAYSPTKPATYAEERDLPTDYPVELVGSVQVGQDPLGAELKESYGTPHIYAMHWLLDVDNWYGFGRRGDGTTRVAYINTFQRGAEESVWEAITQPCWDDFSSGSPTSGYLSIFQSAPSYQKQWKYTNAPDADARAVQAMYWAKVWADEKGGSAQVDRIIPKAAMMGDYIRYTFFDKYFKQIGCYDPNCDTPRDFRAAHYLVNWYFAWGGAIPGSGSQWSWRIGSSHTHQGYQNPMAAFALSQVPEFNPVSATAAIDWNMSFGRQLEYYRWLQSAEGGIAGGATNSWKGRYLAPPPGQKKFYGMPYDPSPVFVDPPSNDWFGFQVWSVQRVAEVYYVTQDPRAKVIMDRWAEWAMKHTRLLPNGRYEVPAVVHWTGQPEKDWDEEHQNFDPKDAAYNKTLHGEVVAWSPDPGTTAAYVHTLTFYAKASGNKKAKEMAKELLDRMWTLYRDDLGVTALETRKDYKRFGDKIHVPEGYVGKMPNGDAIDKDSTFVSIRSRYMEDPAWPRVKAYVDGGAPPEFAYHRFWAQTHIALAYATYGWLFPEDGTE